MNLDQRFEFSVSARAVLFLSIGIALLSMAGSAFLFIRAKDLAAQKAEYRRRLRFLDAATKAYGLASDIMDSYGMGDTAFGIARSKALSAQKSLDMLAKTSAENRISLADMGAIDAYSEERCRLSISSCEPDFNAADARFTTAFDAAMEEASKFDWRPKSEQADDDPLASDR